MAKQIHITFEYPVIALPYAAAAKAVGVSRCTLWRDVAAGKIKEGPHKTFAVAELTRYSQEEGPQQ